MALPEEKLLRACRLAAEYAKHPLPNGAVMRGVTLEGPFLSAEKCGAQAPAYLRKPDAALFYRLQEASGHRIRTVCVAPELEDSDSFIKAVSSEGITVSLAHTACTYEQAAEAFDAGASCVTHLFNAMGAFTHRTPGVLGAAAERDNVFVELIGDGVHLHPATVRLTFRLFGSTRICLISDSMAACGLADGQYQLGGQAVTVQGSRATLADGTLAGSVANLFSVMKRAIEMGISPEDAVTSSALTPAKRLSAAHEAGLILPNYRADVVLCSHHFEKKGVWIEGREIN
jgi:N-acetylglucosamine-6-phosphate deacetylase